MRKEFVNLVKYVPIGSEGDKQELEKIIESIKPTGETYLSAYVEVKKEDNNNVVRYLIYCTDANSKNGKGLFDGSEATKIVILSCGNGIKNMFGMFKECQNLKELDLSKFNTSNVTDMRYIFFDCSSLTELDLSKFNTNNVIDMNFMFAHCISLTNLNLSKLNTNNVTNMSCMFYNCSSLTNLDLSSFNTSNVTNMFCMFYNCFKEKHTATLICKAITLKKITENKKSCLIIPNENENNDEINDIIENNNNPEQIYTCSVERGEKDINPQITAVKEYPQQ